MVVVPLILPIAAHLRCRPGAPGHYLSHQPAARLPDAPGGDEPLPRLLHLQDRPLTHIARDVIAVPPHPRRGGSPRHLRPLALHRHVRTDEVGPKGSQGGLEPPDSYGKSERTVRAFKGRCPCFCQSMSISRRGRSTGVSSFGVVLHFFEEVVRDGVFLGSFPSHGLPRRGPRACRLLFVDDS